MYFLFALLLTLSSCCFMPGGTFGKDVSEVPARLYVQRIDVPRFSEIIIPFAMELRKTHRLRFEDSVVYYNDDYVERVRVIFSSQDILELCDQRDIMVTVVEGLLDRFNADPLLTANFDHYPITASDLELYFSYESLYIELDDPSYIAWMSLTDGMVRYFDGVIKNPRVDYWDARIEPYYKTLQFVEIARAVHEADLLANPPKSKEGTLHSSE